MWMIKKRARATAVPSHGTSTVPARKEPHAPPAVLKKVSRPKREPVASMPVIMSREASGNDIPRRIVGGAITRKHSRKRIPFHPHQVVAGVTLKRLS